MTQQAEKGVTHGGRASKGPVRQRSMLPAGLEANAFGVGGNLPLREMLAECSEMLAPPKREFLNFFTAVSARTL